MALCGGAVGSLVEATLRLIVAVFVEPDVLGGKALQSTHVGTVEESEGFRHGKHTDQYLIVYPPSNSRDKVVTKATGRDRTLLN